MSSNYKSVDKFGINIQEKLEVLKNVKDLRRDMISIRINIEKRYRIVLDQMILKTSFISDDVNEANGICSVRNKIEKINTSIAKLKSISLDMTLLAEFGALPEKWYYKISRDIEGVRRYLMSWQKYWIKEIGNISSNLGDIDDLDKYLKLPGVYIPEFKNIKLNHQGNLENKEKYVSRMNMNNSAKEKNFDIKNSDNSYNDMDDVIKNSIIKTQRMKKKEKK